jgi:membrane associated rhomboid family serine protease
MIPLTDTDRRPLRFPAMTAVIITINVAVFIVELSLGDPFVARWAAVPADITSGRHLETLLTSMFLHGSWSHLIGNMIFLWVFGPEIEDAMGPVRYLAFYLLGGIVAMLAQVGFEPHSTIAGLGASGAIAAVMGAFLITYPRDRIKTILVIGWFVDIRFIPAALLIGFWFLTQLFSLGRVSDVDTNSGGVAYMAHIGGAIYGAVFGRFFERKPA